MKKHKTKLSLISLLFLFALTITAQTIPTDGLVAYYPFNGNANDESGNGNHGNVSGALLVNDRNDNPNSAYQFDGINDFIDFSAFLNTGSKTISIWINPQITSSGIILDSRSSGYGQTAIYCQNNELRFYHYPGIQPLPAFSQIDINIWSHFVFVYDETNTSIKIYQNGQLVSQLYDGNIQNITQLNFKLGARYTNSDFFTGKLDDVRVYNRVLNEQEIILLFNQDSEYQQKFNLISSNPANNKNNIEANAQIELVFNKSILESSIQNSLYIHGDTKGLYDFDYTLDDKTLTIIPNTPFYSSEKINVILTSKLESTDHLKLLPYNIQFSFLTKPSTLEFVHTCDIQLDNYTSGHYSDFGDFNKDDVMDFFYTSPEGKLEIFQGLENETYELSQSFNVTPRISPTSLFFDADNDNDLDLMYLSWYTARLNVYKNNPLGTFSFDNDYSFGNQPRYTMPADFNNDGFLDLATSIGAYGKLRVNMNNTEGNFSNYSDYQVGSWPSYLATGDINNDGFIDIIVGNDVSHSVSIYKNDKNGNFIGRVDINTGFDIGQVHLFDIDNDETLDLIVESSYDKNKINVYKNNGDGTFIVHQQIIAPTFTYLSTYGDINGDGYIDLITSSMENQYLYMYINNNSQFQLVPLFIEEPSSEYPELFDLDEDGILEILVFNKATKQMMVYSQRELNSAPIADAGEDQTVECAELGGTQVTLDGSGSNDPDGDELTYVWTIVDSVIASGVNPSVNFAPGEYIVTLTVDDGNGKTNTDEVTIEVDADLTAPEITLVGDNPLNLYRFSDPYVEQGAEVTDDCDVEPTLTISGSVDITLPGSYNITYEASDFNGNTSQVIRVVIVLDDPAYLANQYLFLSEKKVKLDKLGQAVGNIHSNDKVDIKKGPTTYQSNITALGKIDIKKDITIEGDVRAGGELKLDENVIITGISEEYAIVDYVELIQFYFTSEGEDIKVEKNEMYDITPNSYGKVEIKEGATLNFSTGEYFTKELRVKKNAKLVFDITNGPIKVNVEKKIDIDKEVEMSLVPLGLDDSRYVIINSMKDIKVDEESLVFGSLNAPYGKIDIKKDVEFYGSVSAKEIDVDKEVTSIYHADNNEEILAKSTRQLSNDIELVEEVKLPTSYILDQNYPNPFNPTTNIQFSIPEANFVSLKIFDLLGKEIAVLVDETKSAGSYSYKFDGSNLTSGVYVYRLQAGEFVSTKKLVLMK